MPTVHRRSARLEGRLSRARAALVEAREREQRAAQELRDRIAFAIGNGAHAGSSGRRAAERSLRRERARRQRHEMRLLRLVGRQRRGLLAGLADALRIRRTAEE